MRPSLFTEFSLGGIRLKNRMVMAPMTRSRAGVGDVPSDLTVEYYRQRAGAGLIISEGTQPSANGKGYCRTPGIHSAEQVAGWRKVCDAVHEEGGKIFVQLMHCGRVGSHVNKDDNAESVAPSAITANAEIYTEQGMKPMDPPRALSLKEIASIIEEYAQAAVNAMAAGFDGVELHATSGYLPMQFLSTGANQRVDQYGGNVKNRIRFTVEVLEAIVKKIGANKVGMRICPGNPFNDCLDDDPVETYTELLTAINPLGIAYLHVIQSPRKWLDSWELAKAHFSGVLMLNESLDQESGADLIDRGAADLVSYGRHFIANPDLVERYKTDSALANFDLATLYTPGREGYTDYPKMNGS